MSSLPSRAIITVSIGVCSTEDYRIINQVFWFSSACRFFKKEGQYNVIWQLEKGGYSNSHQNFSHHPHLFAQFLPSFDHAWHWNGLHNGISCPRVLKSSVSTPS
ncbi:unnamed protein product [Nezara viridula]|uniref:Uncharacterized protein n=1 Tax=Nezara viridula TaxID=85310 RepID=A0A9P0HM01_NEZVI|nr:unnamed protein product [Nezara viridula]